MSTRSDGYTVGTGYIARPSMNSCRCSEPNPSGQRREALASVKAKMLMMSKLTICHGFVTITQHLLYGSIVVETVTYQNASRQRVVALATNDEHCRTSM